VTDNAATSELFAAIDSHSSHHAHLNEARDDDAVARVKAALAAGADWRAPLGPADRDAAFTAAICGAGGPLEALLDHGVPVDHAQTHAGTLIHEAAAFSNLGAIEFLPSGGPFGELLVRRGVAPDVRDEYKALRGDDLHRDVVMTALNDATPPILRRVVDGFFVERLGGKCVDFLRTLAEQADERSLLAGLALVRQTSTAKQKAKVIAGNKNGKAKRVDIVHHGDLHVAGDTDANTIVVTGTLRVDGLLRNLDGCVVAVGDAVDAHAIWSEGPFVVGANVRAREAIGCGDNDYAFIVSGDVVAPVFVHLDNRSFAAGHMSVDTTVTTRADVPDAAFAALQWKRR
jgi:hypothetical protein